MTSLADISPITSPSGKPAARELHKARRSPAKPGTKPSAAPTDAPARFKTLLVASCGWPTDAPLPTRPRTTKR